MQIIIKNLSDRPEVNNTVPISVTVFTLLKLKMKVFFPIQKFLIGNLFH